MAAVAMHIPEKSSLRIIRGCLARTSHLPLLKFTHPQVSTSWVSCINDRPIYHPSSVDLVTALSADDTGKYGADTPCGLLWHSPHFSLVGPQSLST